jgi:hypothetical protein
MNPRAMPVTRGLNGVTFATAGNIIRPHVA